jgi:hypothetical protein
MIFRPTLDRTFKMTREFPTASVSANKTVAFSLRRPMRAAIMICAVIAVVNHRVVHYFRPNVLFQPKLVTFFNVYLSNFMF